MKAARFKIGSGVALLLLALAGCGKAVDLDHPGELIPSADPSVLGTLHERVTELRVDDERLYWLTDGGALRGCEKRRCASSVITYTELAPPAEQMNDSERGANSLAGFSVQGGELVYAQATSPGDLLAVDVADPTLTRILATGVETFGLTTDEDAVYVTDGGQIQVFALTAKVGDAPVSIPARHTTTPVLSARGDYVYWFDVDDGHVGIDRARKDGSAAAEMLVADVTIDQYYPNGSVPRNGPPPLGLVVDDSYVYWSENVLSGAIKRLSVTGASAEPETVVAPIRFPMGLWLDGSNLYVEHERDAYQYAVSGCLLDGCQPQLLANGLDATNVFAVDSEDLYTAATTQSLDPDTPAGRAVTELRHTSKKIGGQSP